ncbi:hypothetical protein BHM03_00041774 [Ensete ventricosum]|nr:hypothetical protein BHM03_00041774 [Ensete ventricosum]
MFLGVRQQFRGQKSVAARQGTCVPRLECPGQHIIRLWLGHGNARYKCGHEITRGKVKSSQWHTHNRVVDPRLVAPERYPLLRVSAE